MGKITNETMCAVICLNVTHIEDIIRCGLMLKMLLLFFKQRVCELQPCFHYVGVVFICTSLSLMYPSCYIVYYEDMTVSIIIVLLILS